MGGAEYQVKLLTEQLVRTGEFEIYHLSRSINSEYQPQGYTICKIGNSRGMRFVFDSMTLTQTLKRIQPDTIYQHVGCAYTGIAARYCKKYGCNLVWHVASDVDVEPWAGSMLDRLKLRYLDKKILEYGVANARHIITQTQHQTQLLKKNYGRNPSKLIRNFHPAPTENIDKSGRVEILWVANLKPLKQPEIFIKLARDLSHINAGFTMMGTLQGETAWCNQIAKDIKATSNIKYLGAVPQDEVNMLIAKSHILVNASQYEGFSNTFIQAWMRQVPVISLNVDPDDLLNISKLGYCANGDYSKMLKRLGELAIDQQQRESIGHNAERYALEYHSEKNLLDLISLF